MHWINYLMSPNCIVPDSCMWPKTKLSLRLPLWPKIACIRIAFIPDVCMCPRIALLYLPEIVLWSKTACARRLHVPDIALCPKIAMPKLHFDWRLHVPEITLHAKIACAWINSSQATSIKRCSKHIHSLYSSLNICLSWSKGFIV